MCGLIGIFGTSLTNDCGKFMEQGLVVDSLRGMDSTGIIQVEEKGDTWWYKDAVTGTEFINDKVAHDMLAAPHKSIAYLGHNRAATIGKTTRDNAHPFCEGDIVLTHNGTLRYWRGLPGAGKFSVDSNLVAHLIDKEGAEKAISMLEGAFALVWYNTKEETINFCRNSERPLYFARIDSPSGRWAYASEKLMLEWLLARNKIKIKGDIMELETGKIVSFDTSTNMEEYTVTPVELKKSTVVTYPAKKRWEPSGYGYPAPASKKVSVAEDIKKMSDGALKQGQRVRAVITEWVPFFSGAEVGSIEGFLPEEPWLPIVIRGVHKSRLTVTSKTIQASATYKKHVMFEVEEEEVEAEVIGVNHNPDIIVMSLNGMTVSPKGSNVISLTAPKKAKEQAVEEEQVEEATIEGDNKRMYTPTEWLAATDGVCSGCSADLDVEEADLCDMYDHQTILCPECSTNPTLFMGDQAKVH